MTRQSIEDSVRQTLESYLADLGEATPRGLYDMLLKAVEKPMLDVVMQHTQGNTTGSSIYLMHQISRELYIVPFTGSFFVV